MLAQLTTLFEIAQSDDLEQGVLNNQTQNIGDEKREPSQGRGATRGKDRTGSNKEKTCSGKVPYCPQRGRFSHETHCVCIDVVETALSCVQTLWRLEMLQRSTRSSKLPL